MIWPGMLFNLCVGLLFAGYLFRGVRRFERRADAIMVKLDERHAARMARLDQPHAEDLQKYNAARDEIRASLRAQTDCAIAEMMAMASQPAATPGDSGTSPDNDRDAVCPSGDRNVDAVPPESSPPSHVGT
jgi:hypothetical protein